MARLFFYCAVLLALLGAGGAAGAFLALSGCALVLWLALGPRGPWW